MQILLKIRYFIGIRLSESSFKLLYINMIELLKKLFPINRSLTGNGVRETLQIIRDEIGELNLHEVASGTQVFDWTIPDEWNVEEAYLITPDGNRICDYQTHNLHLVSYSTPLELSLSLDELQSHLYSIPELPEAIPYVTSYYKKDWGFCLPHSERKKLPEGEYQVVIRGTLEAGNLTYADLYIPSTEDSDEEIFISTYICHPSMANNELSGPVVATFLAKWLKGKSFRRYNYRIIFIPETIGSITYLSRHWQELKKKVVAGFNLTCVGDDRCYSYVPTRKGKTLADKIALHVLKHQSPDFKRYSFLDRGSDERQYCAPGIDLPVVTMCRSKYHCYPEYHTSFDNLDIVTESGLQGSLLAHQRAIDCLEANYRYRTTVLGEPQLGKRGLYPQTGTRETAREADFIMNLLAYSDGNTSLLEIAEMMNVPMWELTNIANRLKKEELIK